MPGDERFWTIGIRFGRCPDDIAEIIFDILVEDLKARGLDYEPVTPSHPGLQAVSDATES